LLQDAGTVQDNIVSGDWFVIPGSGTGQLAGTAGSRTEMPPPPYGGLRGGLRRLQR